MNVRWCVSGRGCEAPAVGVGCIQSQGSVRSLARQQKKRPVSGQDGWMWSRNSLAASNIPYNYLCWADSKQTYYTFSQETFLVVTAVCLHIFILCVKKLTAGGFRAKGVFFFSLLPTSKKYQNVRSIAIYKKSTLCMVRFETLKIDVKGKSTIILKLLLLGLLKFCFRESFYGVAPHALHPHFWRLVRWRN